MTLYCFIKTSQQNFIFYYPAKLGYTKLRNGNLISTFNDAYLPAKNLLRIFYVLFLSVGTRFNLVFRFLVLFNIE